MLHFVFAFLSAASDEVSTYYKYADKLTTVVILVFVVVGAYRGWWVPGPHYKRILNERDKLLDLALASQEVGHKALNAVEKVMDK